MTLSGFDSEADRRDAIRSQIVDKCVSLVLETIRDNAVTGSNEERLLLELRVAGRLLKGLELAATSRVYAREIAVAEAAIEGSEPPRPPA